MRTSSPDKTQDATLRSSDINFHSDNAKRTGLEILAESGLGIYNF
jgi:hypothetical protein